MPLICPICAAPIPPATDDAIAHLNCTGCQSPLLVTRTEVTLDATALKVAKPAVLDTRPASAAPLTIRFGQSIGSIIDRPRFGLFLGLGLLIIASIQPMLDQARINRWKADLSESEFLSARPIPRPGSTPDAKTIIVPTENVPEADAIARNQQRIQREIRLAEINAQRNPLMIQWLRLAGLMLLTLSGVRLLGRDQPTNMRLIGGIILALVFLTVSQAGIAIRIGATP